MKKIIISVALGLVIGYVVFLSDILAPYYYSLMNKPVMYVLSYGKAWYKMMSIGYNPNGAYIEYIIIAGTISGTIYAGLIFGSLFKRAMVYGKTW